MADRIRSSRPCRGPKGQSAQAPALVVSPVLLCPGPGGAWNILWTLDSGYAPFQVISIPPVPCLTLNWMTSFSRAPEHPISFTSLDFPCLRLIRLGKRLVPGL